jgi:acetyl esterase/lipase/DNA-binding GntR family transcriptional regulator
LTDQTIIDNNHRSIIDNKTEQVMRSRSGLRAAGVYSGLKKQIMLATLRPGQQLIELELAERMRCSQTTVREALLRLQEDGLIVRNGYRGTVISPVSAVEAHECLDIRARLEARAARQSLTRINGELLDALRDCVRQMEAAAALDDEYALFESDQEFHKTLFRAADLPALVPILDRCSLYGHRFKMTQSTAVRTLKETASRHWKIIEALERADAAEVERLVFHHVISVIGEPPPANIATTNRGEPRMSPSMEVIFKRLQAEDGQLPNLLELPLGQARAQFEHINARWNRIEAKRYAIERFTIPGPTQDLPALRISRKTGRRSGTLLYLHGGGWVFGSTTTHLGAMAQLAELSGLTVIGIDYGLAPEAPFPAGLNDCAWAWRWLSAQKDVLRLSAPWFIAGDSSGANLALALMLDLRNAGEPLPDAALLYYGVYTPDHTTESHRLCGQGQFGLTSEKMAWYRNHYLSGERSDPLDHRASPGYADLAGLPPLFINAAGLDPLRDDSVQVVQRLAEVAVPFEFKIYEGVVHGFMQMSHELPEAMTAFKDAATFIRSFAPAR